MLTAIGKLLVLLNVFVAVAVLAWALSAYVNRIQPDQAVDATGEKLTDKTKRLNAALLAAQEGYAPAFASLSESEARLFSLKAKINARLLESENGLFYNIYDNPGANVSDPNDPKGINRVGRIAWGSLPPSRAIKGLDGKDLRGVTQMIKELSDEQSAENTSIAKIKEQVDLQRDLGAEVVVHNARFEFLKGVFVEHENEIEILVDQRVNWESRGGALNRRRDQLIQRLDDLKKAGANLPGPRGPVASAAPTNNNPEHSPRTRSLA